VEGRDAVAAGNEERLVAGRRRGERPAQQAQALRETARGEGGQGARAGADRLQEQAEGVGPWIDGEDRERPPQRRLRGGASLDHHELARAPRRATSAWRTVRIR
jgi:hypothetical protein